MSELLWCYELFSEIGAYLSYALGFSKSYNTLSDVMKDNTSSHIFSNVVDNILDQDAKLILKPITGGGVEGGVRTGVTIRDVKRTGDIINTSVQALYGTPSLENTVRAVLDLCGMQIVRNDVEVLSSICNVLTGTTTISDWWTNCAINNNYTYVSLNTAQAIVDAFAELGYLNPLLSINPSVVDGAVIEDVTQMPTCNIIYAVRQAMSNVCSLNNPYVENWKTRNLSVNSLISGALQNYDASEHSFGVVSAYVGQNSIHCTIYGFDVPSTAYPLRIVKANHQPSSEYNGISYNIYDANNNIISSPNYYSTCTAHWYGGPHTLEYSTEYGEIVGTAVTDVIGNITRNVNESGVILATSVVSNLLSSFTGSTDVSFKDDAWVFPTKEEHDILTVFPTLDELILSLGGVIGDIITAVRAIPVNLDIPDVLAQSLVKVQTIDWSDVESLEKGITIPDIPPYIPPYIPIIEPDFPSESANKLFSVHTIDNSNMNILGSYLWSTTFVALIEHMFSEPINAVLGMHELHYGGNIATSGNEEIKLGAFGSGAHGNLVSNRYLEFSCGSVTVPEFYGNVEDYEGFTTANLFLPYIGFQPINVNEIMGGSVEVKYGIDVYTGACIAKVFATKDGAKNEIYNFYGQCGCQLPVTSGDYTSLITNAIRGTIGGAITGGVGGALLGAVGGAVGSKANYGRSNGFNNNVAPMGHQKPFILLQRPRAFNASQFYKYHGRPSNWTVTLSQCSGWTRVKDIHLDKIKCTDEEKEMIVEILKEGVIL